jgi:hypothetical protein
MFKTFASLALVVLPAFVTLPAAAEWVEIAQTTKGDRFYVEDSTIYRDGQMVEFWGSQVLGMPAKSGVAERKTREVADCGLNQLNQKQFVTYDRFDQVVHNVEINNNIWTAAKPGTPNALMLNFVCSR